MRSFRYVIFRNKGKLIIYIFSLPLFVEKGLIIINSVNLIGRLVKDPELKHNNDLAICKYAIAIDRSFGEGADFVNVVAFRKSAEFVAKYFKKGLRVGITGRIQTGSYEKEGTRVFTFEVVQDKCYFADGKKGDVTQSTQQNDGFIPVDDDEDLPF